MQQISDNIIENINKAKEFLEIEEFPCNLFKLIINSKNHVSKNDIVLFKQDLGNDTSGFINYTNKNRAWICINYKKTIGHQNFTLAHEIGHFFLHNGKCQNDLDEDVRIKKNQEEVEGEANIFASELLYPMKFVKKDINYIYENDLLKEKNVYILADFINKIVNKYCISFKFVLCKILFNSEYSNNYFVMEKVSDIMDTISPLYKRYNREMYRVIENHDFYKPYIGILQKQIEIGKFLAQNDEMGYDSVESLINKSSELEGFDGTSI